MADMLVSIEFGGHEDVSDEKAFRFRFYCERCDAAYESDAQPRLHEDYNAFIDSVGQLLREATDGDPEPADDATQFEHDAALRAASTQVAEHFHQCPQCGEWICDRCWNRSLLLCEKCAPSGMAQAASY